MRRMTKSGESGDVSGLTIESWKERIPDIVEGYAIVCEISKFFCTFH